MNRKVAHSDIGKIATFVLCPLPSAINRDPQPEFSADKQEIFVDKIFLDDVCITVHVAGRSDDLSPCVAKVARLINVWAHVAKGVQVERCVSGTGVKVSGIDRRKP